MLAVCLTKVSLGGVSNDSADTSPTSDARARGQAGSPIHAPAASPGPDMTSLPYSDLLIPT